MDNVSLLFSLSYCTCSWFQIENGSFFILLDYKCLFLYCGGVRGGAMTILMPNSLVFFFHEHMCRLQHIYGVFIDKRVHVSMGVYIDDVCCDDAVRGVG